MCQVLHNFVKQTNNDDTILSCCKHYCKDHARDFMPKSPDEPTRFNRDVVLLTDDRNLRLKAHTDNVPVKDVPSFCTWAAIRWDRQIYEKPDALGENPPETTGEFLRQDG